MMKVKTSVWCLNMNKQSEAAGLCVSVRTSLSDSVGFSPVLLLHRFMFLFSVDVAAPHFSCVAMVTIIFSFGLIFHPLTRISVVFFCPAVFLLWFLSL